MSWQQKFNWLGKKVWQWSAGLFWSIAATAMWELWLVPNFVHPPPAAANGVGGGESSWHIDFTKPDWNNELVEQGHVSVQKGITPILAPTYQAPFTGGTMLFEKLATSEDIEAKLVVTPLSESHSNTVIQVDHLIRCIIGNGDYRNFECQQNQGYPATDARWVRLKDQSGNEIRYLGSKGLEPKKELTALVETRTEVATNRLYLTVRVNGFEPGKNQQSQFGPYYYVIKLPFQARTADIQYGFGIIGVEGDDTTVSPRSFDGHERID